MKNEKRSTVSRKGQLTSVLLKVQSSIMAEKNNFLVPKSVKNLRVKSNFF